MQTGTAATWGFPSKDCLLLLLLLCCALRSAAQEIPASDRIHPGEAVTYDLYFKWGLLMPRAGHATLSIDTASFVGRRALRYRLLFGTAGLFERIYPMHDSIDCHFSPDLLLLQSEKRSEEGGYYSADRLTFRYDRDTTEARSIRYTRSGTKIDTTLQTVGQRMYDILGATLYLRSIEWETMKPGDATPFNVAIGRDIVNISFRYAGQKIVERGNVKYRTRLFYVDIYDEAFTQNKEAAEIWVGDDANHLPVRIRAKLKIGAAEVYYHSSEGLRHPLDCRVEIRQ